MQMPEEYTRTRYTVGGRKYIAKEDGSKPLMLVNGKWVESDGAVKFPQITKGPCPLNEGIFFNAV